MKISWFPSYQGAVVVVSSAVVVVVSSVVVVVVVDSVVVVLSPVVVVVVVVGGSVVGGRGLDVGIVGWLVVGVVGLGWLVVGGDVGCGLVGGVVVVVGDGNTGVTEDPGADVGVAKGAPRVVVVLATSSPLGRVVAVRSGKPGCQHPDLMVGRRRKPPPIYPSTSRHRLSLRKRDRRPTR